MPLRSNIPNVRTRSDLSRLRLQLQQDSSLTPEERARILSAAQASLPEDVTPELEGLRGPTPISPLPRPKPTATTVPEPPPMLRRPDIDPLKKPTAGPGSPGFSPGGPAVPTPALDAALASKPKRPTTALGLPRAEVDEKTFAVRPFAETILGEAGKYDPGSASDTFGENLATAVKNAGRMVLNVPSDIAEVQLGLSALSQMSTIEMLQLADGIVRGGAEVGLTALAGGEAVSPQARVFKVFMGAMEDHYSDPGRVMTEHPLSTLVDVVGSVYGGAIHGTSVMSKVRTATKMASEGRVGKAVADVWDAVNDQALHAVPPGTFGPKQTQRVLDNTSSSIILDSSGQGQPTIGPGPNLLDPLGREVDAQGQRILGYMEEQKGLPTAETGIEIHGAYTRVPNLKEPFGRPAFVSDTGEVILGVPLNTTDPHIPSGTIEQSILYALDRYPNPTGKQMTDQVKEFYERTGNGKPPSSLLSFLKRIPLKNAVEAVANGRNAGGKKIEEWYPAMAKGFLDRIGAPNIPEATGLFSILSQQYSVEQNTAGLFTVMAHMRRLAKKVPVSQWNEDLISGWIKVLNETEFDFYRNIDVDTTRDYYRIMHRVGEEGLDPVSPEGVIIPQNIRNLEAIGRDVNSSTVNVETDRYKAIQAGFRNEDLPGAHIVGGAVKGDFEAERARILELPGQQKKLAAAEEEKDIRKFWKDLDKTAAQNLLRAEKKAGGRTSFANPLKSLMPTKIAKQQKGKWMTQTEGEQKVKMADDQIARIAHLYITGEFGGDYKTSGFNSAIWENAVALNRGWDGSLLNISINDRQVARAIGHNKDTFTNPEFRAATTLLAVAGREMGMDVGSSQAAAWLWGKLLSPGGEQRIRNVVGQYWPYEIGSDESAFAFAARAADLLKQEGINPNLALTPGLDKAYVPYAKRGFPQSNLTLSRNPETLAAEPLQIIGYSKQGAMSNGYLKQVDIPLAVQDEFHRELFWRILTPGTNKIAAFEPLEAEWGFRHHVVTDTYGTRTGREPGYVVMVEGSEETAEALGGLLNFAFQQQGTILTNDRRFLPSEARLLNDAYANSTFDIVPAVHVRKADGSSIASKDLDGLDNLLPDGYDYSIEPGNGGMRFYNFVTDDNDVFMKTLREALDNSGTAYEGTHFTARSRYVGGTEATDALAKAAANQGGRGGSRLSGGPGRSSNISARWFYDSLYKPYRKQITDYYDRGLLPPGILNWSDQPEFIANPDAIPDHLKSLFPGSQSIDPIPLPMEGMQPSVPGGLPSGPVNRGPPLRPIPGGSGMPDLGPGLPGSASGDVNKFNKYPPVGGGSFVSEEALSPDAIRVWHGTPFKFDPEPGAPFGRFRDDKLLTGEGHMTFSAGHYMNDAGHAVVKEYQKRVTRKRFGTDPVVHVNDRPLQPLSWHDIPADMQQIVSLGGVDEVGRHYNMERILEMARLEDMPITQPQGRLLDIFQEVEHFDDIEGRHVVKVKGGEKEFKRKYGTGAAEMLHSLDDIIYTWSQVLEPNETMNDFILGMLRGPRDSMPKEIFDLDVLDQLEWAMKDGDISVVFQVDDAPQNYRKHVMGNAYDILEDAAFQRGPNVPISINDVDRVIQDRKEIQKEFLGGTAPPDTKINLREWSELSEKVRTSTLTGARFDDPPLPRGGERAYEREGLIEEWVFLDTRAREVLENLLVDAGAEIKMKQAKGYIVEAVIKAAEPDFILWDKPFSEQSKKIQDAAMRIIPKPGPDAPRTQEFADNNLLWEWKPSAYFIENLRDHAAGSILDKVPKDITDNMKAADFLQNAPTGIRELVNPVVKGLRSGKIDINAPRGEWVIADYATGQHIWYAVNNLHKLDDLAARDHLLSEGVRGVKFLDAGSRNLPGGEQYVAEIRYPKGLSGTQEELMRDILESPLETLDHYLEFALNDPGITETATYDQLLRLIKDDIDAAHQVRTPAEAAIEVDYLNDVLGHLERGELGIKLQKATHNWVVYNPADLEILRVLGLSAILFGGTLTASGGN